MCSGQRASLGSLWAIPRRGWLAEQTHGTVSGTSRETGHPPGHSDEQRQQAQGTGSPCQEHSHTRPPSSAGGTAPCRPALGIPEGEAEENTGLAPAPQIPLSPPPPTPPPATCLCLVLLATAGPWGSSRTSESPEPRRRAEQVLTPSYTCEQPPPPQPGYLEGWAMQDGTSCLCKNVALSVGAAGEK